MGKDDFTILPGGKPGKPHVVAAPDDPNPVTGAGGVQVAAMSNGLVRLHDTGNGLAIDMPVWLAADVGQRLIAMSLYILRHSVEAAATPVAQSAPKIDLIRGTLRGDE